MAAPPASESPENTANNERSLAIALAYAPGDTAPRIVAKGRGLIADEIIRRAR